MGVDAETAGHPGRLAPHGGDSPPEAHLFPSAAHLLFSSFSPAPGGYTTVKLEIITESGGGGGVEAGVHL